MARTPATRQEPPPGRILQAALELVAGGGYEALQVRAISQRAGCRRVRSTRKLPLARLLADRRVPRSSRKRLNSRGFTNRHRRGGRNAAERVDRLISELTQRMTANREAEMRCAVAGAAQRQARRLPQYVHGFGGVLQNMLASAIAPEGPTAAGPGGRGLAREHLVRGARGLDERDDGRRRYPHRHAPGLRTAAARGVAPGADPPAARGLRGTSFGKPPAVRSRERSCVGLARGDLMFGSARRRLVCVFVSVAALVLPIVGSAQPARRSRRAISSSTSPTR